MLGLAWLDEIAKIDFDPVCLGRYNWKRRNIASGYVLSDHFLSVSTSGDSMIEIQMLHSGQVSPELRRTFRLFFDGNDIKLEPKSVYISGHLPTDIAGLSQSERDHIDKMDQRYRTSDQLDQHWQQIWNHYVFSAFERWCLTLDDHRMAELELECASSRLRDGGKLAARLARQTPAGPRKCNEFIVRQVQLGYSDDVHRVKALCKKVDDFPRATHLAKTAALEALGRYWQHYSIEPARQNIKVAEEDSHPESGLRY